MCSLHWWGARPTASEDPWVQSWSLFAISAGGFSHLARPPCYSNWLLQFQAHLSNHCCCAAGTCSSVLSAPQQVCLTHRAAQGSVLVKGGLLNRIPILPCQSSTFAPWITHTWAALPSCPLGIATAQFHSCYDASAFCKEKYLTLYTSSKLSQSHPFVPLLLPDINSSPLLARRQLFPSGHSHQDCICLKWEKIVTNLPGSFLKQQMSR